MYLPSSVQGPGTGSFLAQSASRARGFTLVEMLVATTLTLLMMATVATIFTRVSDSMRDSRSTVGMNDRLRSVRNRLQSDLAGVTVTMLPPRRPEWGEGYFEYIEGPIGPVVRVGTDDMLVVSTGDNGEVDETLGDNDDILMFTTRNLKEPFIGRFDGGTIQSTVAEVCWFVRGTTLYRRVLLVAPGAPPLPNVPGFYGVADVSVRQEPSNRAPNAATANLVANSLADLTKRENRYGHQPYAFPHDARFWGRLGLPTLRETSHSGWPFPYTAAGSPVSSPIYGGDAFSQYIVPQELQDLINPPAGVPNPAVHPYDNSIDMPNNAFIARLTGGEFDAWTDPFPWNEVDSTTGNMLIGTRIAEDVILTNVLAFDVKAWDPNAPILADGNDIIQPGDPTYTVALASLGSAAIVGFGAYVDLNYMCRLGEDGVPGEPDYSPANVPMPFFHGPGDARSRLRGTPPTTASVDAIPLIPAVYDTWSYHYEHDGIDQDLDGIVDQATDGLDNNDFDQATNGLANNNFGGVDDESEWETAPPYRAPLRGLQVKIRVFDPDSRQIREVTIRQDFLPE